MSEPTFHYEPLNEEETRFNVYADPPGDESGASGGHQGIVYQTADRNWVADWTGRTPNPVAMPGLSNRLYAAEALYWYAPPVQSFGSRPMGKALGKADELNIDKSQCGCCIDKGCGCEGLNRTSGRFGVTQSYQVQPSLIPAPGGLVSLPPIGDQGLLVDFNTHGAGTGIGYLKPRDDGRYDVHMGTGLIGTAPTPETGMWACIEAHTRSQFYNRLLADFEPHPDAPAGGE